MDAPLVKALKLLFKRFHLKEKNQFWSSKTVFSTELLMSPCKLTEVGRLSQNMIFSLFPTPFHHICFSVRILDRFVHSPWYNVVCYTLCVLHSHTVMLRCCKIMLCCANTSQLGENLMLIRSPCSGPVSAVNSAIKLELFQDL